MIFDRLQQLFCLVCLGEKVKGLVFCEASGPSLSLATFTDLGAINIFKSVSLSYRITAL